MGYYSRFTIIPDIPLHAPDTLPDEILSAFEEITEYSAEYFNDGLLLDGKWYSADQDMVVLSKRFPEVASDFERIGEEGGEGNKYVIKNGVITKRFIRGWVDALSL